MIDTLAMTGGFIYFVVFVAKMLIFTINGIIKAYQDQNK